MTTMGWLRILAVAALSLASLAHSEPVQYCRRGGPSEIDFCLGALIYSNTSTSSHDLFLTFTITRHSGSALGWTAVGAGNRMNGALMLIIYGDPLSPTSPPIVSIRASTGHSQPALLSRSDLPPGMDLRVVSSLWAAPSPASNTHTATVHLVCYSCDLWPTADLSPLSSSQPWIWAWNPSQPFDVYTFDAHLAMHKHHAGAGGWGNFYLDMRRAVSTARYPPSLPPIRPGVDRLGASDTPLSLAGMVTGKGSIVHGALLALVFLVVFPIGVGGIRSGRKSAYAWHWMVQCVASVGLLAGVGMGIAKGGRIAAGHQVVGLVLGASVGVQGLFGWWHHVRYVKRPGRTWVSHVHIWYGRLFVVAGWVNVGSGLLLRGYGRNSPVFVTAAAIACVEGLALGVWLFWAEVRRRRKQVSSAADPAWAKLNDTAFVVADSDDESEKEGKADSVED